MMPPTDFIAALRARGSVVVGTATSAAEAKLLAAAQVDAVAAQGTEAGGHRGTFIGRAEDSLCGTLPLVRQIRAAVELPVIAAGGIMDGAGVAAALLLGASAAQLGTAFLACPENTVLPAVWRRTLLEDRERGTMLSRAYTGRLCRFIRNRYLDEATAEPEFPAYPHMLKIAARLRSVAAERGAPDFAAMLVGQGYPLARELKAADLVATIAGEARAALAGRRLN
jgi:nitronate monooxygenase